MVSFIFIYIHLYKGCNYGDFTGNISDFTGNSTHLVDGGDDALDRKFLILRLRRKR